MCNRSIILTDFDGHFMGLILHKGSSSNSGHYISMVKVGDIWFECDDVRITKIEFNHFCKFNTVYMLFYKRSTWWKQLRGIGLVLMDAACWVSWGEGIETPYSTGSSRRSHSMHCLLSFTFVSFLILWPLSPAASRVSWNRSCLVCSGLAYEIYNRGGPSMYVYCVICYRAILIPYVRSVGHVFAYIYTLDDSESPIHYATSLLPKIFPLILISHRIMYLLKVIAWKWKLEWKLWIFKLFWSELKYNTTISFLDILNKNLENNLKSM